MNSALPTFDGIADALTRLRPIIGESPIRRYPLLDDLVGHDVNVIVKHENHLPVNTFKVRNALTALLDLDPDVREAGVVAASTGNHGQGLAWAGARLGIPVTICVPIGNNPEKSAVIRSFGATVIEVGASYDESAAMVDAIAARDGSSVIHSTNNGSVLTGAGTMTLEVLRQAPDLDVLILALGGGSQCVGAITVREQLHPALRVIAVQSEAARAQHDAWHDGQQRRGEPVATFAEGIACGSTYDMTFDALRDGLDDFVLVRESDIAQAVRDLLRATHNVVEGAGAAGLAGARLLGEQLAGMTVGIVLCGGNMDTATLRRVLNHEL